MDRGWVGNGCGPNRRIGHGYDNACQSKDMVERLILLCGENNRGSKSADIGWKMNKKVELRLRDENAGGTNGGHIKEVFDCSRKSCLLNFSQDVR